ncbi:glycosyl transferase [Scytonema sp. UIC 10036]|uniref:glycosyltransferase family protein n=1 Tax=Scytonema sp. UIC 10036 TaxID=2304196 RepID=UPI0012DABC7C|nr:glycosyltransferase [Scytonema sp. UIC 10036]MUG92070.1 glycosyl transferase [Scytonema sp. UIC 10036]
MKKIMFYCQYHLGMGHLIRSVEILHSLAKDFKVCFVKAGTEVQELEIPPAVEVVTLPLLLSENKQIKVADSSQNLEEVKENRKNLLLKVFDEFKPDCLITEGYPFKKYQFEFESIPLLERIQSTGRSTKVVCSLRDIVMAQPYQNRAEVLEKTCKLLNQYYDMLLVHSDPQFHRLEESFSRVKDIHCDIRYTGYVAQSLPENCAIADKDFFSLNMKEPMILVSVGGGQLGHELLESIVEVSSIIEFFLPHQIIVFTGPFIPDNKFLELQESVKERTNISIRKYTPHLLKYMEKAAISISLGGYNTTMNIVRTGVRAMILPSNKDWEQEIRAEKLEKLGMVEVIRPYDLEPVNFTKKIIACLNKEPVKNSFKPFELQGAQKTALLLKELLQSPVTAAYSAA